MTCLSDRYDLATMAFTILGSLDDTRKVEPFALITQSSQGAMSKMRLAFSTQLSHASRASRSGLSPLTILRELGNISTKSLATSRKTRSDSRDRTPQKAVSSTLRLRPIPKPLETQGKQKDFLDAAELRE